MKSGGSAMMFAKGITRDDGKGLYFPKEGV
jgi:hypothetical protein